MSDFFNQPMIRATMAEIQELQEGLMHDMVTIDPTNTTGTEQIRTMRKLLEKQRNFVFRLGLCNDPDAEEMKEQIMESARFLGLQPGQSIDAFFDNLEKTLTKLEESLDT
jgi:hypothetical protein|tara:strand:- start:969 stop:1298 length:330 start_codon:yes stop_codon:yes gene_type:complete